jgi:hypothetical protein
VLDLSAEPLVLTLPEVTERYFTYQFLDAWTESFAYLGTRATGGRAGRWLIAPPGTVVGSPAPVAGGGARRFLRVPGDRPRHVARATSFG